VQQRRRGVRVGRRHGLQRDGSGTVCDAVAGLGSPEGPAGSTCSDGVDNDCDGFTDDQDAGCNSSLMSVSCALPYLLGKPGSDCTGWHLIRYQTSGVGPDAVVTAELVGLDTDGNVIQALPVQNGDFAHLSSRLDPADWKFVTRKNPKTTWH